MKRITLTILMLIFAGCASAPRKNSLIELHDPHRSFTLDADNYEYIHVYPYSEQTDSVYVHLDSLTQSR